MKMRNEFRSQTSMDGSLAVEAQRRDAIPSVQIFLSLAAHLEAVALDYPERPFNTATAGSFVVLSTPLRSETGRMMRSLVDLARSFSRGCQWGGEIGRLATPEREADSRK